MPGYLALVAIWLLFVYLGAGILFAPLFVFVLAPRVDPLMHGAGAGVRLILLPGAALCWPILLRRYFRGLPMPEESNEHRLRAKRAR